MIKVGDLRKGMAILLNGEIHMVTETEHRTPGNLRAFIQLTYKNLNTGKIYTHRYRPSDDLELVELVTKPVQFSYKQGSAYHFMQLETYEMLSLSEEEIGDYKRYLAEGMELVIRFHNEVPVHLEMPSSVSLKVVNTMQGVKGNTVSNVTKPAELESGYELAVPLFIKVGDVVKIDTRTGEYLGKA